jgi:glycerol-3-phosphate O-acyltransferase
MLIKNFIVNLQKILDKIVSPQVLGDTKTLENTVNDPNTANFPICYVIQDDSTSNKVLIDNETEKENSALLLRH